MDLSDLAKTVAKFAPALGALLPIPGGAEIGAAIAAAFGGDVKDPQGLSWKIEQDPDAQVKLTQIQANLKIGLRQADVAEEQAEVDDTKSARDMWVKLAQAGDKSNIQENLAYILLIGTFVALLCYMFTPTVESKEIINGMCQMDMLMLGFFYGSAHVKNLLNTMPTLSSAQVTQIIRSELQKHAANQSKLDLPKPTFSNAS